MAKRQFWGHEVLIGRFVDAVVSGGPAPVTSAEALAVVDFTDSVLSSLNLSAGPRPRVG